MPDEDSFLCKSLLAQFRPVCGRLVRHEPPSREIPERQHISGAKASDVFIVVSDEHGASGLAFEIIVLHSDYDQRNVQALQSHFRLYRYGFAYHDTVRSVRDDVVHMFRRQFVRRLEQPYAPVGVDARPVEETLEKFAPGRMDQSRNQDNLSDFRDLFHDGHYTIVVK